MSFTGHIFLMLLLLKIISAKKRVCSGYDLLAKVACLYDSGNYGLVLNIEVHEDSDTDTLFNIIEKEYINFLFFNYEEGKQNISDFNEQKDAKKSGGF